MQDKDYGVFGKGLSGYVHYTDSVNTNDNICEGCAGPGCSLIMTILFAIGLFIFAILVVTS